MRREVGLSSLPASRAGSGAGIVATFTTAWIAVGVFGVLARARFELSSAYPVTAAAIFAAVIAVALPLVRRHHHYDSFGPANQITTARAAIVALVAALIGERAAPSVATVIAGACTAVAIADGVDGWIARRTRLRSAFGARFDVEVDAALILVLAILVWQYGKAGSWIVAAGLLRYAFVAARWFLPWMRGPLAPSRRGRTICVVQIAALIAAIAPIVVPPVSTTVAAAGLVALGYSFAADTIRLWKQAA